MVETLATLSTRLSRRVDKFESKVDKRTKFIVGETVMTAAEGTPVDSGEARSNWRISAAVKTPGMIIPPYVPGEKLGINETANLAGVRAHANRVLALWKPAKDRPIAIFNNWDHIERLNSGEISQQGSHFIERAKAKMVQLTKQTKWFDR